MIKGNGSTERGDGTIGDGSIDNILEHNCRCGTVMKSTIRNDKPSSGVCDGDAIIARVVAKGCPTDDIGVALSAISGK